MSQGTMTIKHEASQSVRAVAGSFGSSYFELNGSALVDTPHTINDDFFIEDLSEFSNEDIAAPIPAGSFSPRHSDDTKSASTIKSDCTANTAHTDSSATVKLFSNELKDASLSLPCEDETGFDWLASLEDENLLFGGSNFGMDHSFLLNDSEPFSDYSGVHMKKNGYDDAIKAKEVSNIVEISPNQVYKKDGQEDGRWDDDDDDDENDLKNCDGLALFVPHATGSRSARTKRARLSGWSSTSSILCNNWSESSSPTNSLSSSSQIIMPITPKYGSNHSFICNQEEGYNTHLHHAAEINVSSRIIGNGNSDRYPLCDFNKASKIGFPEPWPKEDEVDNSREESGGNYGGSGLQPRRCTHCQSQKTPQWRAGPQGPKTLCNACGVRYKSGRLFDEYRPAKSPTFLSYKHSNSHKKVMEMRRRKSFHYNHHHHHHHQQTMHQVCTLPLQSNGNVANQQFNVSKLKIKLNNPANSEPVSTHFSDVTLIPNRNASESPSSLLY